jgi:hypothetical protein
VPAWEAQLRHQPSRVPTPLVSLAHFGRREPGQNGRTRRPRARSSSLRATLTPVAAQPSLQPTALLERFFTQARADCRLGSRSRTRRAAAELLRWAGGFLGLRLPFGCSAPPPSTTRVHCRAAHQTASVIVSCRPAVALQPATACSSPAPRMLRRRSPSRFARGFTACHGSFLPCPPVTEALPKSLQLMCADREAATPAAPPNPRCSRPPSRCDFPCRRVPTARGGSHRCTPRAAG